MIYLDSAATSFLKPPCVAEAVAESFGQLGNAGRGAHAPTLNASRLAYETREALAELFHAPDPARIAFCLNVTDALNMALTGLIGPGDHVITTAREHNSVLRPLYRCEMQGTALTVLPADPCGRLPEGALAAAFRENTRAVVLAHASNVTGTVTDLRAVSREAHRHGALLIVDAAQSAGALPIDVQDMGIDLLCFTGHKGLLGPQGTGGIWVREGISVPPFRTGGSGVQSFRRQHPEEMPAALEAGTLNGHGLAGLLASARWILGTGVEQIAARERMLTERFLAGLREHFRISVPETAAPAEEKKTAAAGVRVRAGTEPETAVGKTAAAGERCDAEKEPLREMKPAAEKDPAAGTEDDRPLLRLYLDPSASVRAPIVSLNLGDEDSAYVADRLWEDYGICVRAGAHCAPLMHEAMGTVAQGAVRFSFSFFNTEAETDTAVRALAEIAADLR